MLTVYKPIARKILTPLAQKLENINPNLITIFGLIFPLLFFALMHSKFYIAAAISFILNLTDMLDGLVATTHKKTTPFGGFLDSTIDRISDFIIIATFGFTNLVSWNIILPLLLTTSLISYIRSRTELAARNKLTASIGIIERTERIIIIFISLVLFIIFPKFQILNLNLVGLIFTILLVLSIITIFQRIIFAYKNLPKSAF